jgi:hypothetical protein
MHQTIMTGSPVYSILILPQKQLPVGIFALQNGDYAASRIALYPYNPAGDVTVLILI